MFKKHCHTPSTTVKENSVNLMNCKIELPSIMSWCIILSGRKGGGKIASLILGTGPVTYCGRMFGADWTCEN